jgi:SAM-dependent methyltransferase
MPEGQADTPILIYLIVIFFFLLLGARLYRAQWQAWVERVCTEFTASLDTFPVQRLPLFIALGAAISLFMELMAIRMHSSFMEVLAYYKNVSLLSCFLGLGLGYARARSRPVRLPLVLPLFSAQMSVLFVLRFTRLKEILVNPVTEYLSLMRHGETLLQALPVYLFILAVFSLNAACFIPLGHAIGRLMLPLPPLKAYAWNLVGSLLGIAVFSLACFMSTPPLVWAVILFLGVLALSYRHTASLLVSAVSITLLAAVFSLPLSPTQHDLYSPYQILTLTLSKDYIPVLKVNNVYFQRILDLSTTSATAPMVATARAHYRLPYLLQPKPRNVLVVGSGTGNDVAAALRESSALVDAVEIDPVILKLGRLLHPEQPYQNGRVKVLLDDARSYIRKSTTSYDLIVYGLLDSHTLASSLSSIRLDSFVYTVEAFKEARRILAPGGVLCISAALPETTVGLKLFRMLKEAFEGANPVVYETDYDGAYAFCNGREGALAPPPLRGYRIMYLEQASSKARVDSSTDDWPFFYMPHRTYPFSYVMVIALLCLVSFVFIRSNLPLSTTAFSGSAFFLGAGFMLLETKAITELALLFGSTWMVTTAVIAAVLIMGFAANWFVDRTQSEVTFWAYALLVASLLGGLFLQSGSFGGLSGVFGKSLATLVLTLPLLFAGVCFSGVLKEQKGIEIVFSSNLFGAICGGFLEYNSMYFGYRALYFGAIILYLLAFVFRRTRVAESGLTA